MAKDTIDQESAVAEAVCLVGESESVLSEQEVEVTGKPITDHSRTVLKLYAVVFCINFAMQLLGPAQIQVYENIYCAAWYEKHPHDSIPFPGTLSDRLCKIAPIQQQVSTLKGWKEFFAAAPGLLLSVPVGVLADSYGRRNLALLTLTGIFLGQVWVAFVASFGGRLDLHFVWLGAIFNLLGGGGAVAELLLVCLLTDVHTAAGLTVAFFRATSFGFFSKIIGPVVASTLMRFNAWYAIGLGLGFLFLTVVVAATIPETLPPKHNDDGEEPSRRNLSWKAARESVREVMKIWSDWRLVFVALTYPFRMVCYALTDLIQRYVSSRYGWTLAEATLMYSIQAAAAGIMLFTFLPWISNQIDQKYSWSSIQKNVVLSRMSLLMLVFAYAVIGLAPTAPIMVMGLLIETLATGLPATMRALASALVEGADVGRVFSVLAVVETLSTMMAFPVAAAFFNVGLAKGGGIWLGLPYDTIAAAGAIAFVAMSMLRFERRIEL